MSVVEGYIRLYRVDGRTSHTVDGLTGRWFSDDVNYIKSRYARPDTPWFYVDVPTEVAEESRYEQVRTRLNLYGVEGKDFILPQEWADRKIPLAVPPEVSPTSYKPLRITEITSNVARVGKVLDYDRTSGRVTVVKAASSTHAVLSTKIRKTGFYEEQIVPVRYVTLTNTSI